MPRVNGFVIAVHVVCIAIAVEVWNWITDDNLTWDVRYAIAIYISPFSPASCSSRLRSAGLSGNGAPG